MLADAPRQLRTCIGHLNASHFKLVVAARVALLRSTAGWYTCNSSELSLILSQKNAYQCLHADCIGAPRQRLLSQRINRPRSGIHCTVHKMDCLLASRSHAFTVQKHCNPHLSGTMADLHTGRACITTRVHVSLKPHNLASSAALCSAHMDNIM